LFWQDGDFKEAHVGYLTFQQAFWLIDVSLGCIKYPRLAANPVEAELIYRFLRVSLFQPSYVLLWFRAAPHLQNISSILHVIPVFAP
jgi:hypothetical protein